MRGWKKYFLNANIYGADIDKRILFEEERIKTYFVDQTNENTIHDLWNNIDLKHIMFDIIIDDGLHDINANLIFLENSLNKLKNNGIYVIEDVVLIMIPLYEERLNELKNKINFNFEIKKLHHYSNNVDNCLIFITK